MEWLYATIAVILVFIFFVWCFCKVSGDCSREEEKEQYRNLDTKKLDDDTYWENDLVYDDEFVKKKKKRKKVKVKGDKMVKSK